jgi:LPXTG-motif cell wall-anchored protein
MGQSKRVFDTAAAVAMVAFMAGAVSAQTRTTSTELKQFEVVSVDGNRVVVKGEEGAREITVADDFRLTVDGQPIAVRDLRPGMKGTARITTTTVVIPVQVTEVKNGEVVKVVGSSVIVRTPEGNKMFSESDVSKRGVKITIDGKPVALSDLREGTKLTATIVTTGTPRVMTEREVDAAIQSAARAEAPAPTAAAPVTTARRDSPAGAAPARRLPKTASPLPLVAVVGVASSALGLLLTIRRRRRS